MGIRDLTPSQMEFFEACRRGDLEKIKDYIANKKSKRPRTPLNFLRPAVPSSGWLASSKDPSTLYTPLHCAALNGSYHACKILIESDKLLSSARDKRGCIPLHLASWNGHYEAVELLSEVDPESVDAVNNAQESSLHLAAQHGHDRLVRVLLEHHADPRLRNARFETPLDVAARTGHAVVCKILIAFCPELTLQSAVDCSSTGESGQIRAPVVYPLHAAARHSHIQCLQILRLGGFDIDFVTDEGSALHVAAMFGQVEAVKYLTNEGINPHVRDSKGRTALELLREHEQHRVSDLTHIIQSREGWSECRQIIEGYMQRFESEHFNSSSDSGIDRRDSEKSVVDDDINCEVWRPLPSNLIADFALKPSSSALGPKPSCNKFHDTEILVSIDEVRPAPSRTERSENEGPLSDTTTASWPHIYPHSHRTWNSRMYDVESGVARFPITSPMNKTRHQKSKRTSGTLPMSSSSARTGGVQQRGTILSSDPQYCIYRPPPVFDTRQQKFVRSDAITHTYNPTFPYDNVHDKGAAYDNAPLPSHSRWDHDCSRSVGKREGSSMLAKGGAQTGIQTLPSCRPRLRPSLEKVFAATKLETPPEESNLSKRLDDSTLTIHGREDSIGLGNSPNLNSRDPSVTFACSTLGRSVSPDTIRSSTPTGRAPLAMPEELTGSTSTSILSSSVSPERESLTQRATSDTSSATCSAEQPRSDISLQRNARSSTDFSYSTLTASYSEGPTSPDSLNEQDILQKELLPPSTSRHFPLCTATTECSTASIVSSCSLPMVSQFSTTPTSDYSLRKLNYQNSSESDPFAGVKIRSEWVCTSQSRERDSSKGSENQSINELDEWSKIDDILSSFGGAVCRESVFASTFEPQVAVFLRDRRSQALTLQLSSPLAAAKPSSCSAREADSPPDLRTESDCHNMSQWLVAVVGVHAAKADEVAKTLTMNGFDKPTQLHGCLTTRELSALGIDKSIQQQIVSYLSDTDDPRPNANNFNYVSDWLCSLELTDYLGNFVTAGLKSMLVVRTAELTRKHLEKMGITLQGHVARILYSLSKAKAEDICMRRERLKGMQRAVTATSSTEHDSSPEKGTFNAETVGSTSSKSLEEDLLHGQASYSAHYLGSMEISNIDGTEESRRAMTELKKSIREIAKVPQVILEISIHGVRILDGKNGRKAAEHDISHIQIVCQDERDLNCFTYISQDAERNLCHVFCVLTADVATEIIVTLGHAFELAYKLQNGLTLDDISNC